MQQKHQTLGNLLPKCDLDDSTDKEDEPKRADYQTVEHIKLEPEHSDDNKRTDYDCMDYEEAEMVDTDEPSNESENSSYSTGRKIKRKKSTKKSSKSLPKNVENGTLTALVAKYITAKCDKCPGEENAPTFTSFEDANEHHLTIHDQPGYLICCDKRLSSKKKLRQHITWHQDQKNFK